MISGCEERPAEGPCECLIWISSKLAQNHVAVIDHWLQGVFEGVKALEEGTGQDAGDRGAGKREASSLQAIEKVGAFQQSFLSVRPQPLLFKCLCVGVPCTKLSCTRSNNRRQIEGTDMPFAGSGVGESKEPAIARRATTILGKTILVEIAGNELCGQSPTCGAFNP
jgi:hypothetical protein